MADRFGALDANGHIRARHDPDYVNPTAGYEVDFDASSFVAGSTPISSYSWTIDPATGGPPIMSTGSAPTYAAMLPQGDYRVALTVTAQDGQLDTTTQLVTVKDILIVSIGDSYASGEGNPLEPQKFDFVGCRSKEAVWGDTGDDPDCVRCHRSVLAGPAQAALQVEQADPHTSVTFVSFACSGAKVEPGVLQPYPGVETPPGSSNLPLIPAQIDQVNRLVQGRPIDALVISIGGNDAGFSKIISACVLNKDCQFDQSVYQGFARDVGSLPYLYSNLAGAIANNLPPIGNVYITEYPDPTRDDNGDLCDCILCDGFALFNWLGLSAVEAQWVSETVVPGLNDTILAAATEFQWSFVTGISAQYLTHGYCASDHWLRRITESLAIQGPTLDPSGGPLLCPPFFCYPGGECDMIQTTGAAHPNEQGHLAYARQIAQAIIDPGPTYTAVTGTFGISDRPGDNGWWTGTCVAFGGCSSDEVLLSVLIEASRGIVQMPPPSLRFDGSAGCPSPDVGSCGYQVLTPNTKAGWFIHIREDGIHHADLWARDDLMKVTRFSYDIKVDLHDPSSKTPVLRGTPAPSPGWYRSPVDVLLSGFDSPGGSGVARIEYRLDGGTLVSAIGASANVQVTGEARHVLSFEVVDNAGRRGGSGSATIAIDATPPVLGVPANVSANATAPDGAVVALAATAVDNVDPSPVVSFVPPSGSKFAIGVTTVTCTARDAAGNATTKTFLVTVKGAAEQLTDLVALVEGLAIEHGVDNALQAKLSAALSSLAAGQAATACSELQAFLNQVAAQGGKRLTATQATTLDDAARRIMSVIGCSSLTIATSLRGAEPTATIPPLPTDVELLPAGPSPFGTSTSIGFALPRPCSARLDVYDMAGRRVTTLVDGWQAAGRWQVTWNGTNQQGTRVTGGIYLCRLEAGGVVRSQRTVLLP